MNSHYEKIGSQVRCIDDEIPFELPNGWEWCRLGSCINLMSGRDMEPHQYNSNKRGIPYMTGASNFINGELIVNRWTESPITIAPLGSLLITCKGTIGELAFNRIGDIHIARQIMAILGEEKLLSYIRLFLEFKVNELESQANSMIPGISRDVLLSILFPMPPREEQKRITSRFESLSPLIEQYSHLQGNLSILEDNICSDLKKSVLQYAIEGKLVSQDPADEPAIDLLERIKAEKERLFKEKKIKRDKCESVIFRGDDNKYYETIGKNTVCIDEEIPFEIPKSWEWCRLGTICGYIHRGKSPIYGTDKTLPIIAQKCNQWDKLHTDRCLFADAASIARYSEEQYLQLNDILINSTGTGTVGRTGFVSENIFEYFPRFVADSHVTVVRCFPDIFAQYIYRFLVSPQIQIGLEDRCSGSTNQKELSSATIANYIVPLPPLAEQHRIVQKIDELFAAIN